MLNYKIPLVAVAVNPLFKADMENNLN